jgi:hypothetical protein
MTWRRVACGRDSATPVLCMHTQQGAGCCYIHSSIKSKEFFRERWSEKLASNRGLRHSNMPFTDHTWLQRICADKRES